MRFLGMIRQETLAFVHTFKNSLDGDEQGGKCYVKKGDSGLVKSLELAVSYILFSSRLC